MIQIIIFSFNRAFQLGALLASIQKFWKIPDYQVSILYNTTDGVYQKAYDILQQEYPSFKFVKETNKIKGYHFSDYFNVFNLLKFLKYPHVRGQKSNFRDLLNDMLKFSSCEYSMYLTDDSVFIRDVALSKKDLSFIDKNPEQNQISLRLGRNISNPPGSIQFVNDHIEWDFHKYRNDNSWGYNFSVDAHIYSTKICFFLQSRIIYNNPTTLEAHVCHYVRCRNILSHGLTFENPYILSFPINMVQSIVDNESMGISTTQLNQLYLDGYRLEYIVPENSVEFQQYPENAIICKDGKKKILKFV